MSTGNADSAARVDESDPGLGQDAERDTLTGVAGPTGDDGISTANEAEPGTTGAYPSSQAAFEGQQAAFHQQRPYGTYHQGTPPSPTVAFNGGYDIQSLLMQQQAVMAQQEAASQYNSGVPPAPPLTPIHAPANVAAVGGASNNVPASPLFTAPSPLVYPRSLNRLDSPAISKMAESSMASPLSPLPYLTAQALPGSQAVPSGYGGILQGGGAVNRDGSNPSLPADNAGKTWSDSLLSPQQQQASPYLQPHNVQSQFHLGMSSSESNHSSHSFDEMLPPAYGGRDPSQGMYPYQNRPVPPAGMSQGGAGGPYGSQQQWGGFYSNNRGPPGPYGQQGSWNIPGNMPGGGFRERGGAPYPGRPVGPPLGSGPGQHYYAATTPGPPIQTSPCNKGPDGANLFIFHIPNHFTNLDMYNLFCHYGNLLSVRIMVDKDTGRSRGFGFVSYDSPDAAAMAIKELNGFVIGNKRLKVQHKQIRPGDQQLGGGSPQHYQQPQHYHAPTSGGTLTTESSATGTETIDSAQLPQWHNPNSLENPNPPSSAPFAPLEGSRTVGETMVLTGAKSGESSAIDAAENPKDEPITRVSQIQSQDGQVTANGKEGPTLSQQVGMASFPTGAAANVTSSSTSPLAHLDAIRDALPDVSK